MQADYRVVGMDGSDPQDGSDFIEFDLSSDESVHAAVQALRDRHGESIASVIHLAAYFDFTGDRNPLYEQVNVQGTRRQPGSRCCIVTT